MEKEILGHSRRPKKNKNIVDIEVENALYKRAVGYEFEETTIEIDDEGKKKVKKQQNRWRRKHWQSSSF